MQQPESNIYYELTGALKKLASCFDGAGDAWLLGGSCGLWLQGVPLEAAPRDIDVYADQAAASRLHERLKDRATDEPHHDRSGLYASLLSHYRVEGVTVELVGAFEVRAQGSLYRTEVDELLAGAAQMIELEGISLPVMPLAHEFVFNLLRGRPDRYLSIAKVIRREPDRHLPLLYGLLERNWWSADLVGRMAEMLDRPLLSLPWREYRGEA
ncbi:hypothetical protein [Paenibacillus macerans]|uniref:hypothetical protein n=1 Tax=Paenibacillus macerans TaxID=44252 RepID=UPI003D320E02